MNSNKMEVNKKRGRKPKGGKIMDQLVIESESLRVENVILHLKCNSKDIGQIFYNNANIEPYTDEAGHEELKTYMEDNIHQKLKNISLRLHSNDINGRSDCFWCTCPYETPPIYIPKAVVQGQYQVYGSFCCPECAAGYLFTESIDHSTKFERYHLLNGLYGELYGYEKSIIPAPAPHYMLTKFFGSLTIQEYRQLIREKVIMVLDKPICCTYPELIQSIDYTQKQEYKLYRKKVKKMHE